MATDKPIEDTAKKTVVKKPSPLEKLTSEAPWTKRGGKGGNRFMDQKSNAIKSKGIRGTGR